MTSIPKLHDQSFREHTRDELVLRELRALRRLLDEFIGIFLNAKFPYGKPTDRWARR